MTTYCEEMTSLRPGPTDDTVPAGATPLAQMPHTSGSRTSRRNDLNRSDPRRHLHRSDPRRHDRRHHHRGADGAWTGRTQVLHEPLTERLTLHEPVTERIVRNHLAALGTHQLTEQDVESEAQGLVAPPGDHEVYSYFGAQMRWVQVLLLAASVLAGWSLLHFALASIAVLWPMLIVLGLNGIGTLLSSLTSFNTRRVSAKTHRKLVEGWVPSGPAPSIDVFLPTYGEDVAVLRNTYTHVKAMEWVGKVDVHVLDDGDRGEVGELAAEFGFDYVVRPNRGHLKKAGNLQYAFARTSGDHIVILDADFCPRPDFLRHLVPYMDDPAVGIVQSPQYFDSGETLNWIQRTAGSTQELFYRWILPSRDRVNAAICVGTCALYRRKALEATGGFAHIEHSEEIHTGLHLMQAGFQTRYVPIVVSRGLCPGDMAGFLNQQYRWCNGSLVKLHNAKLDGSRVKMTLRQRLCFWAGLFYYITTAVNVLALYLPGMIMAAFFPSQVQPAQFVPFLVGLWVYLVVIPVVSKSRWRFEVLRLQMAYSYAHLIAIAHKLRGRSAGWVPTGAMDRPNPLARSISRLGAVAITASLVPFWGVVVYDIHAYGVRQYWLMAMFVGIYTYLALPLLVEFIKILWPSVGKLLGSRADAASAPATDSSPKPTRRNPHRISAYEAVCYTLALVLAAAVASGWFDLMIPWSS
jgi:cellulose synthase/poly-beta-1,6-N-acetylglucosamine synthase-like glycosyltransferase